MSVQIRVTKNLLAAFSSQQQVYGELESTGETVADGYRQNVHVDTEELLLSILSEGNGTDTVMAGATAEHAPHEELGTRYRAGHPALVPAFNRGTEGLPERIGGAVRRAAGGS